VVVDQFLACVLVSHTYINTLVPVAKKSVLRAFQHLLRPLVRVLLRNGVSWDEFAELCKKTFVEVARDDYGIQGRPTNTSRVALITGLSRREVMRVKELLTRGDVPDDAKPTNRISQILTAWHVDADFLARDGKPADLPLRGDGASIATLLSRYAGDMPHVAVFKELTRLGLVKEVPGGFRVTSRDYIRSASDPDLMRQAGVALHDHATTIAHNVDAKRTEPAWFERMATNRALPRRHVRAFRKFVANEGQALLERIDAWLAARARRTTDDENTRSARDRPVRTGVGVYLIHDDERQHGERRHESREP
jgi:hypothetical protein